MALGSDRIGAIIAIRQKQRAHDREIRGGLVDAHRVEESDAVSTRVPSERRNRPIVSAVCPRNAGSSRLRSVQS